MLKFSATNRAVMPKYGNTELFQLIKSLNKAEKAYFKKFAERHVIGEKNNYLKLFDAIDRQEVYDEGQLKKEAYVKQLPYLKNYLRGIILKSMQSFYAEHTTGHRIRRMMDDAWFLYRKRLYTQCADTLGKIKSTAEGHISGTAIIDCFRFEEQLMFITLDPGQWKERMFSAKQSELQLLEDMMMYTEINFCYLQLHVIAGRAGVFPDERTKAQLRAQVEQPLLALEKKTRSPRNGIILHHALAACFTLLHDYEAAHHHGVELLRTLVHFPGYTTENPIFYAGVIGNHGQTCVELERYGEAMQAVKQVRKIKATQPEEEWNLFFFGLLLEMLLCLRSGNYEEGARAFEHGADAMRKRITGHLTVQFSTVYVYAILCNGYAGKYKEGLRLINELTSRSRMTAEDWTGRLLYHLQIIFLHELKQDVSSFVRNLRRKLKGVVPKVSPDFVVLDYIEKTWKTASTAESRQLAKKTLAQLKKISGSTTLSGYFDLETWLESKADGRSFTEVMKARKKKIS